MGLALRFLLLFPGRLPRGVAGLSLCVMLAVGSVAPMSSAQAQSFTWGGTGSTTNTGNYNLSTEWGNPPAGAPPLAAGQSAIFNSIGSAAVSVTAGPITPDS